MRLCQLWSIRLPNNFVVFNDNTVLNIASPKDQPTLLNVLEPACRRQLGYMIFNYEAFLKLQTANLFITSAYISFFASNGSISMKLEPFYLISVKHLTILNSIVF